MADPKPLSAEHQYDTFTPKYANSLREIRLWMVDKKAMDQRETQLLTEGPQ